MQLIWTARVASTQVKTRYQCEEIISYLPLSHVAAQVVDIFLPMVNAGTIYFAQPDALRVRKAIPIIKLHFFRR